MNRLRLYWLGRLVLCAVFAAAAVPKLLDPASFAQSIGNYHLLPASWVGLLAVVLPSTEITVAGALLWTRYSRGAALLAAVMLTLFGAAQASALLRGIDIACGCFGQTSGEPIEWTNLVRNAALAALAGWLCWGLRPSLPPADTSR